VVYSPVPHSTALTVRDSVLAFLGADMLLLFVRKAVVAYGKQIGLDLSFLIPEHFLSPRIFCECRSWPARCPTSAQPLHSHSLAVMKVGFLGSGMMARALAGGFINAGAVDKGAAVLCNHSLQCHTS
jgi:hypothetical protein